MLNINHIYILLSNAKCVYLLLFIVCIIIIIYFLFIIILIIIITHVRLKHMALVFDKITFCYMYNYLTPAIIGSYHGNFVSYHGDWLI